MNNRKDVALVNFMPIRRASTISCNNIARYLADKFGFTVIDNKEACKPKKYAALVIVNGASLYCDFREELKALCEKNDRIIYVGNDYKIEIPSQISFIKKMPGFTLVANHDNFANYKNYKYVNFNQLTFEPNKELVGKRYSGIAYYGAYREGRELYFKKYFSANSGKDVFISSSIGGRKKFTRINPKINFFEMKNVIRDFSLFESTIYIEDKRTHKLYNSPANRFYECLSAGVLIYFDKSCLNTFNRAGIDISEFVIDSPVEIIYDEKTLHKQRELLYKTVNYRAELDREIEECFDGLL